MAAAAASSRSRGVAGGKGLVFIFTLLCLVSLSKSQFNQYNVDKLIEEYQTAQQTLNKLKDEYQTTKANAAKIIDESASTVDSMTAWARTLKSEAPEGFPPVDKFMETAQGYMNTIKAHFVKQNEIAAEKIKESEEKQEKINEVIQALLKAKAEL